MVSNRHKTAGKYQRRDNIGGGGGGGGLSVHTDFLAVADFANQTDILRIKAFSRAFEQQLRWLVL